MIVERDAHDASPACSGPYATFGPDATKEFMTANGVALILRSHEGPDAREDRPELPNVQEGFCVDHHVEGVGKLCTVFSAPDYPQFVEEGEHRYHNKAAYVVLTAEGGGVGVPLSPSG